jgi:hypothetical protein
MDRNKYYTPWQCAQSWSIYVLDGSHTRLTGPMSPRHHSNGCRAHLLHVPKRGVAAVRAAVFTGWSACAETARGPSSAPKRKALGTSGMSCEQNNRSRWCRSVSPIFRRRDGLRECEACVQEWRCRAVRAGFTSGVAHVKSLGEEAGKERSKVARNLRKL